MPSARTFALHVVPSDGADVTLRLAGELDAGGAPELHAVLSDLVGRGEGDVTIDLGPLEFVDSVGLGAMLKAAGQLERQGRTLHVTGAAGAVRRTIEIAGCGPRLGVAGD
jgi:anti-sigma B factor antagonist